MDFLDPDDFIYPALKARTSQTSTSGISSLSDLSPILLDSEKGMDRMLNKEDMIKFNDNSGQAPLSNTLHISAEERRMKKRRCIGLGGRDSKDNDNNSLNTIKITFSDYDTESETDSQISWQNRSNLETDYFPDSTASLKRDEQSIESEVETKPKVVDFGRDIVRVNVCGQEHFLHSSLLSKYPHTLLGSAERERYFRPDLNSYYFDRNRHAFDAVMGYYLSGGVFMYPAKLNREVVHREMSFYKIPIYDEHEVNVIELPVPKNFKEKAYMLLNYPKSSNFATALSVCDCALIFIAVAMLILETEPKFKDHFEVTSDPFYKYLFGLNTAIMLYFTIDYLLRLFTHPSYKDFFKMFLPWLDLLSILPFYVEVIMIALSENQRTNAEDEKSSSGLVVLRLCRIFRVTRVFKFARRSENLLILLKAVGNTYKELILLSGVVSLAVVSFGSIMYTIESLPQSACINTTTVGLQGNYSTVEVTACEKTKFSSILISCWWAVITVTTVGYGDMIPLSTLGKCMGSFAVFCGLIIIALPATIIVTRFSEEYERTKMQNEMNPCSSVAM